MQTPESMQQLEELFHEAAGLGPQERADLMARVRDSNPELAAAVASLIAAHERPEGSTLRIGFRPFAVQVSPDLGIYRCRAVLRHTYFLGVMLRLELELASGLIIRSRMTKEEYALLGLRDGLEVSFSIRRYRILRGENEPLSPEFHTGETSFSTFGAGI